MPDIELTGDNAFYKQSNYLPDLSLKPIGHSKRPEPAYTWNTESKIWRIAKVVFAIIIFPVGLYWLLHSLAGKLIIPASSFCARSEKALDQDRAKAFYSKIPTLPELSRGPYTPPIESEWKIKRICVEVDGYQIDAAIIGRESTFGNKRWVLASNGNAEFYEDKLNNYSFKQFLTDLNGNAIVFNYPGTGASSGMPNRSAMAKAYRTMLRFLEDKDNGLGAEEIISYSQSIGGGVEGDALLSHKLQEEIKYVFIKSRTFSDLSTTVSHMLYKPLGWLTRLLGWNMGSVESSKQLKAPEIVLQTVEGGRYIDLSEKNKDKLVHDGVIPAEATLALALLSQKDQFASNKLLIGITDMHNAGVG
ncbi:hypothetical protein JYU14_05265, partial [Simkania negevensis]|nr:hypothetical protein [Simkania negevensis]